MFYSFAVTILAHRWTERFSAHLKHVVMPCRVGSPQVAHRPWASRSRRRLITLSVFFLAHSGHLD
jgi:hypothetical protein